MVLSQQFDVEVVIFLVLGRVEDQVLNGEVVASEVLEVLREGFARSEYGELAWEVIWVNQQEVEKLLLGLGVQS